jgi:putative endonuclease
MQGAFSWAKGQKRLFSGKNINKLRTSRRRPGSHFMTDCKKLYVYILTDKPYGTLYIGQTNNLARRMFEHKNGLLDGFSKKYGLKRLVYYEAYDNPTEGFARERAMKEWKRQWKIDRIHEMNRDWADLSDQIL